MIECDVCGLPDLHDGAGDGIGSCDCPRCDGGEAAASSVLCICPPDYDPYSDGALAAMPDDGERQRQQCCPMQTEPPGCECPDECQCMCPDCTCANWGEEYDDRPAEGDVIDTGF